MRIRKTSGSPAAWVRGEGGWGTLIGILIAIVIISVLAVIILKGTNAFSKPGAGGTPGAGGALAVKSKAQDQVCRSNLGQFRMALQLALSNDGVYPATKEEAAAQSPGLSVNCPVGEEPYEYDPATGSIRCVHPGHGGF